MTDTTKHVPAESGGGFRAHVLGLRVSEVLERYPGSLPILIEAGFGPLAVPALRAALAPTVTLRQALRIRGLGATRDAELLDALERMASCPS